MTLFDPTMDVLSKSLDMHLLRHTVISDNIANAETPGFKARRVEFEAELQRAVEANDPALGSANSPILDVTAKISQDPLSEMGQDLNTVDMDREMATLKKNDVQYSAATEMIGKKFSILKYAISEGNGQ